MHPVYAKITCTVCYAFALVGMTAVKGVAEVESNGLSEVEAILQSAAEGRTGYKEAERALYRLPPDDTVAAIVQILDDPTIVGRADVRVLAYKALLHHDGGKTASARQKLISCLGDPAAVVASICCRGLDPETRRSELDARVAVLEDPAASTEAKQGVLKELARWKDCGSGAIAVIQDILHESKANARVRRLAAAAVLDIGGLAAGVEGFQDLDALTTKAAMTHLARYIVGNAGYGKGLDPEDAASIPATLDLCVEALASQNREVRKRALEAFWYTFGYACYLNRTRNDYGLSTQHRMVLENVAQDDPEPGVRQEAAELLDPDLCDQFAQEYRRRAERRQRGEEGE